MSEEPERREPEQAPARAELQDFLEALVRRFDGEGRREAEPAAPPSRPEIPQRPARQFRPPRRPYPDTEDTLARPAPDVDDVVTLQAQVRDEIRELRQTMREQHQELLAALQDLGTTVESRPARPDDPPLSVPSHPERPIPSPLDEYQQELLDDLHRATRRLLNWYVALADELAAGRSRN